MTGDGRLPGALQAYRKARDQLHRAWDDERSARIRGELLGPLDDELDAQSQAWAKQAEHREAAARLSHLACQHLDEAQQQLTGCIQAQREAALLLESAATTVDAGMSAVGECDDLCDRAMRELEAAVACGGKIPVSQEALYEIGRAASSQILVEAGKQAAAEAINQGVEQLLGAGGPGADLGATRQLVDRVIEIKPLYAAKISSWWNRLRGRK